MMATRQEDFPEKTAVITGLDQELVQRFAVILQAITSSENIDVEKFRIYTRATAERYVELYGWYYMSATVHKLLIHGADIIKNCIVPIGILSEEASEARNKDFRRFKQHNSRKNTRENSNEDIIKMMLVSSDPFISSMRPKMRDCRRKQLKKDTLDLFVSHPDESDFEFCDISNYNHSDTESDESDVEV